MDGTRPSLDVDGNEDDTSSMGVWVAKSRDVEERHHLVLDCLYRKVKTSLIIIRFSNQCYAYLNKCVHMPFRLDCENKDIFDQSRNHIKCSMHGIIYDPVTGVSLSPTMCTGEKLTSIGVREDEMGIWLEDEKIEFNPDS